MSSALRKCTHTSCLKCKGATPLVVSPMHSSWRQCRGGRLSSLLTFKQLTPQMTQSDTALQHLSNMRMCARKCHCRTKLQRFRLEPEACEVVLLPHLFQRLSRTGNQFVEHTGLLYSGPQPKTTAWLVVQARPRLTSGAATSVTLPRNTCSPLP